MGLFVVRHCALGSRRLHLAGGSRTDQSLIQRSDLNLFMSQIITLGHAHWHVVAYATRDLKLQFYQVLDYFLQVLKATSTSYKEFETEPHPAPQPHASRAVTNV